jgi:hypothetical protein
MPIHQESVPKAIEVMTAWLEAGPGVPPEELLWQVIRANTEEGREAEAQMTMGLVTLAGSLLLLLEEATGRSPSAILHDIALRYQ